MDKKTLTEIDFFRIRDEIADYCVSEEGKENLSAREPFTNLSEIEKNKNLSREWAKYFSAARSNPVLAWDNVKSLIPIIKTDGASLSLEQIKNLGRFLQSVSSVKKAIKSRATDLELKFLPEQIDLIPDMSETEKIVFRVISPDGEMRELPEITNIRKQIASLNSKIKTIMRGFISDSKYAAALESFVPVLRNGRQVLAVKASLQNRIPGIVHEVSQTAQTVFVEPEESVICSNELLQKEFELQAVIKKILAELTKNLQPSIPAIKSALPVMIFLDVTQAAERWGRENNCRYAETSNEKPPLLLKARHPLLKEKAVPIDIRFFENKRVLIITGPNTGGKTVSLKTFALFSMLNQSGFPIPAEEGTRLPVFEDFFADIGDDQSLDQSLSTFSGHMKNIARAVNFASDKTLVLLDELGSGTDPQEGTAIAMAVLDKLIEKKSFVLATTHQGVLKNYGYVNPCCVNASVEFNQDTLSPNYRLLMGVPGESHALDIAKKSGLPSDVCDAAKNYVATEQSDVSALIRGLNEKHVELDRIQKENENQKSENLEKFEKLKRKELDLRRKENELKKGKQQELNDFLIHSRRQLENLVRNLKEGEITREKTLGVKKFINDLAQSAQRFESKIEAEEEKLEKDEQAFLLQTAQKKRSASAKKTKRKMSNAEALKYATSVFASDSNLATAEKKSAKSEKEIKNFAPGAYVVAGANKNEGVLIEEIRKGVWQVQFGSVKMAMKQKDLKLSENQKRDLKPTFSVDLSAKETNGNVIFEKDAPRPVFELRLLGMRAEEALNSLERQIDLCLLNNFLNFSVIHGKGDGILQQVVQDYLSHSGVVSSFEFAPAEDGGFGKTYVKLKG